MHVANILKVDHSSLSTLIFLSFIMPKEFRKRGKKTKKGTDKDEWKPPKEDRKPHRDHADSEEVHAGPSWIIPASKDADEVNLEAPYGYLDADVKAYFRTVDVQIRNWQENETQAEDGNEDGDPNEGESCLSSTESFVDDV